MTLIIMQFFLSLTAASAVGSGTTKREAGS